MINVVVYSIFATRCIGNGEDFWGGLMRVCYSISQNILSGDKSIWWVSPPELETLTFIQLIKGCFVQHDVLMPDMKSH